MPNRIYVKVKDSRYDFTTGINATFEEAQAYYLNQTFNFGCEDDLLLKCIAVELVSQLPE